jgi:uncharacterized protein (TIGR00255 family)
MIQSMTAFARVENNSSKGNFICELRSINHRYFELSLRIPEILHELESVLRERIRTFIQRGKVECHIRYHPNDMTEAPLTINAALAKKVCSAAETIAGMLKNPGPVNIMSVLHWPGILETPTLTIDAVRGDVLSLLDNGLQDLVAARHREGAQLNKLFLQRLDRIQTEIENVKQRLPVILQNQRQRLQTRFNDAKLQLDTGRLEQEIVIFAQKIDVAEELERVETHITEVRRVLEQGDAMGRRLDFLMQELNREANTLGSKSTDSDTTRAAVELKVLIEQIREQVQNIE